MAEAQGSTTGAMGAAEGHLYDAPTDTPLGLYTTTLVRHQTGKGKVKEIRLQPSQTDLSDYFSSHADTSMEPLPENLPLYTSASGGEPSQAQE